MPICTHTRTSLLTVIFIAAVRAVILSVTSPWQPDTASRCTAELIRSTHGGGWRERTGRLDTHTYTIYIHYVHKHIYTHKQILTAVLLIWLVITVKLPVTPPASVDAHPTAAHELHRTTRLVGGCRTHTTNTVRYHENAFGTLIIPDSVKQFIWR